ncbi:hypothetical protein QBC40DRAFT_214903 [Triangularia verruculosa]|uniref:Uncharacterized protein n=1 Tax=Triangularia verruculosa TaxID=2587418 RepID=A0AAN6XTW3_9PEZI|nr:hypothetical protein QBC40DRAFT_214903 [Triangularia verruculosa]
MKSKKAKKPLRLKIANWLGCNPESAQNLTVPPPVTSPSALNAVDEVQQSRQSSTDVNHACVSGSQYNLIDTKVSQQLWVEAYKLIEQNEDLVPLLEKYHEYLEAEAGESGYGIEQQLVRARKLAQKKMDQLQNARLHFFIGKRKIVIRDSLQRIFGTFIKFKDLISAGISAEPHAGIIWAGAMVLVPFLENIFQLDEVAAQGLERVIFLLVEYRLVEATHLSRALPRHPGHAEALGALRDSMVDLYSQMFAYQIRLLVQYGPTRGWKRMMRTAVDADGWKDMIGKIESKNLEINSICEKLFSSSMLRDVGDLMKDAQRMMSQMDLISETTNVSYAPLILLNKTQLLDKLPCAPNAMFDSKDVHQRGKALPGTQVTTLGAIQQWATSAGDTSKPLFWLRGMAGTGKTSVARAVADALDEGQSLSDGADIVQGTVLGASFFFQQGDPTRDNGRLFFTTIAKSLAQRAPMISQHITSAIEQDDDIGTKSLPKQFDHLVLAPLAAMSKDPSIPIPLRLVVVVDAMDECSETDAQQILRLLGKLPASGQVQLRVLVISRPEVRVSECMPPDAVASMELRKVPQPEAGTCTHDIDDITKLLNFERARLSEERRWPEDWLTNEQIKQLRIQADGLFIYAATACRFLDQRLSTSSRNMRLGLLFDGQTRAGSPQQGLDDIYRRVLRFSAVTEEDEEERKARYARFQEILGVLTCALEPLSLNTLKAFLPHIPGDDIDNDLGYLHSILDVPGDEHSTISLVHLSFREFLFDEKRSGDEFSISESTMHGDIFERSRKIMMDRLHEDMCDLKYPGIFIADQPPEQTVLPQSLSYPCRYWADHIAALDNAHRVRLGLSDGGAVHHLLLEKLLNWLEALSIIRQMPAAIHAINSLLDCFDHHASHELAAFLKDCHRFVLFNQGVLEKAPLQVYSSAMLFAPERSPVKQRFIDKIPSWIKRPPVSLKRWGPLLYDFSDVKALACSPTDNILVTGSNDGRIAVRNVETGAVIASAHYDGTIQNIAFTPDGKSIAFILTRDYGRRNVMISNLQITEAKIVGHSSGGLPQFLQFSPDGQKLYALNYNSTRFRSRCYHISCWDMNIAAGKEPHVINLGPLVSSFSFSPDGTVVAIQSIQNRVTFWDLETGKEQGAMTTPQENGSLMALSYSPVTGTLIAVGFRSGRIAIYQRPRAGAEEAILLSCWSTSFTKIDQILFNHDESLLLVKAGRRGAVFRLEIASPDDNRFHSGEDEAQTKGYYINAIVGNHYLVHIASRQGGSGLWNVNTRTWLYCCDDYLESAFNSPDGSAIALPRQHGISFWDETRETKMLEFRTEGREEIRQVFFSHDSELIGLVLTGQREGASVRILSRSTWSPVFDKTLTAADWSNAHFRFIFCPEKRSLAGSWKWNEDEFKAHHSLWNVVVWDLGTGGLLLKKEVQSQSEPQIGFSPDGDSFVASLNQADAQLLLADLKSQGEKVIPVPWGADIKFAGLDNHGNYLRVAIRTANGEVTLWDPLHGTEVLLRDIASESSFPRLIFSSSGLVVTEDRHRAFLSDATTGELLGTLNSPRRAFSPALSFGYGNSGSHLVCRRGRVPLPQGDCVLDESAKEQKVPKGAENCLWFDEEWVMQGFARLLWLPPPFRGGSIYEKGICVKSDAVVTTNESGDITTIEFDLLKTPMVGKYSLYR